MFVNPITQLSEPDNLEAFLMGKNVHNHKECAIWKAEFNKWQQAQKKIIFKRHLTQDYLKNGLNVKTIGELFEATNGTLELQNIEL